MNFKELKNRIKQEQKDLAQKIRICKPLRKPKNWDAASEETQKLCRWNDYSREYRHRHIIYCNMFNSTSYDLIENPRENNIPNGNLLLRIQKQWESELDEVVCDCA